MDLSERFDSEHELFHYGTKRHSGRYPWGSGETPYQHSGDFLARVEELRKKGLKESEIIKALDLVVDEDKDGNPIYESSGRYRTYVTVASNLRRLDQVQKIKSLKDDGKTNSEIARILYGDSKKESTVRSLLNDESEARNKVLYNTVDFLQQRADAEGFIDVGKATERVISAAINGHVSPDRLSSALDILEIERGYKTITIATPNATQKDKQTTFKVLCSPEKVPSELNLNDYADRKKAESIVYKARNDGKIKLLEEITDEYNYDPDADEWHPSKMVTPKTVDPSRIFIKYAEDGGSAKDGVIEIRPGVDDLSMDGKAYGQVRIATTGTTGDARYLKGMAIYSKDIPDGYDILVNSSKSKAKGFDGSTKSQEEDPDNPFGAVIKRKGQHYYIDPETGKKELSAINFIKEESDWDHYDNSKIAAQFLSKQPIDLIQKQINLSVADQKVQYEDVLAIKNPALRKKMLLNYAEECDKKAQTLETAPLPGQKWHVILPVDTLKDNECYAPGYPDGTKLALVRYPHGGLFEIPEVIVNNKHKDAKDILGSTEDAIGINKNVAERLSGADFDGDTVVAIPTGGKVRIQTKEPLKGLRNPDGTYFDGKISYPPIGKNGEEGASIRMKKRDVQNEMGKITNLITDMTVKGADDDELARAVKHSMVIIDAYKHELDYKRSEAENGILELKDKWQGHYNENGNWSTGSGTVISRAGAQKEVLARQGEPIINVKDIYDRKTGTTRPNPNYDPNVPEGAKIFKTKVGRGKNGLEYEKVNKYDKTNPEDMAKYQRYLKKNGMEPEDTSYDPNDEKSQRYLYVPTGKWVQRTQKSTQMAETYDAFTLSSGTVKEDIYAAYANSLKDMANKARIEYTRTPNSQKDKSAEKAYAAEVKSLQEKVDAAYMNKPRERIAQELAYSNYHAKKLANPDMTTKEYKKIKNSAIQKARDEAKAYGKKYRYEITDREWEAIDAGAFTESFLKQVFNNADPKSINDHAFPKKETKSVSQAQINKIKAMSAVMTQAQIADSLGLSVSTVSKYIHS